MYNEILFTIMNVVFFGYLAACWILFGSATSISATFYDWPEKYRKIIFLAFCWGYAIPAIMMAQTGLLFFAGGFLSVVGIASDFRSDSQTSKDHTAAATIAVVLSQLSIIFDYKEYLLSAISIALMAGLFLIKKKMKTFMYWAEIIAFLAIDYVIAIKIL